MPKYGLSGKIITEAQYRDSLVDLLSQAADLMATAEGCHSYIVSTIEGDESAVWVSEIWESKEAHDKSLSIAGVAELIAQARPMIRGMEQMVLTPVHGKGL